MVRWRSSRAIVLGIAWLVFGAVAVLPILILVVSTMASRPRGNVFGLDARQWTLLLNTAILGLGTSFIATVIGAPLGIALARIPMRGARLLRLALAAPALLPPYVAALAWIGLTGSTGWIATLTGSTAFVSWTYSMPAAMLVMGLVLYPLVMLAAEVGVRRIDGRLEEAALLVTTPLQTIRRITVPLAARTITAAVLIVFVLTIGELAVPGLLRVPVYTTEVFTAFAAFFDAARANIVAIPLLTLSLAVAVVAAAVADPDLTVGRRVAMPPLLFDRYHAIASVLAVLVLIAAVGFPLLVLVREAASVRSFAAVVSGSGAALVNSLTLSALGATAVLAVAIWTGYGCARAAKRIGRLATAVLVTLFAVPGTIVGIGLITLWNRPGPLGTVYGTDAMFVLGYLARFLPVATLALAAAMRSVPTSHEEAAAIGGAGWLQTVSRIVLPQLRGALGAVWVLIFVLAFGELGASILITPPGESTLPIRVYTIIANAPSSHVAALALLQVAVAYVPLAAFGWWWSGRETR